MKSTSVFLNFFSKKEKKTEVDFSIFFFF